MHVRGRGWPASGLVPMRMHARMAGSGGRMPWGRDSCEYECNVAGAAGRPATCSLVPRLGYMYNARRNPRSLQYYRGGSGIEEVVRPTRSAEARSADLSARSAEKNFSHVFSAMRKRSRNIKMAVLGKKRPWLLWSFNGRPTTRTRNRCHCRVCI